MPIDLNTLLNEVRCLGCGSMSESEMIIAGLLQRIAEAGGGGGGGTPSLPLNSVQFNDGGALGGDAGFAFDKTNKTVDLGGGTLVANDPVLSLTQTWNNAAVAFTGLSLAITDTASGATAKLFELLGGAAGATSLFSVSKTGRVTIPGAVSYSSLGRLDLEAGPGWQTIIISSYITNFNGDNSYWVTDASDVFAIRNPITGATAQTFRVYRTFTDSTNYERLALQSAAGQMIVAAETAGTGTDNIDLILTSAGTGIVTFTQGIIRHGAGFTVAGLPAAGTVGRRAYVTNALAPAYAAIVAGGGAVIIPVYDDGTNWRVG